MHIIGQWDYSLTVNVTFRFIPNDPLTANKNKRKGKVTITGTRMEARNRFWLPLKNRLRIHLEQKKGNQIRMAQALGIESSQLHRYTCPICEHDQEPSYTIGKAIEIYLDNLC